MQEETRLEVNVYSPDGLIYTGSARMVKADTPNGEVGILPHHISLITLVDLGAIVISGDEDNDETYIAINGGIMDVHQNVVNVLASYAIQANKIDEAEVLLEKQEAEADMETAAYDKDTVAYTRAKVRLKQAVNQINVRAKKIKTRL